MTVQFTKISSTYTTSKLPEQFSNQIYYSENSTLNNFTYRSSYSLKFVVSGFESYQVQGREMIICPNEHLLVNDGNEVTTIGAHGKAISLFIAPETLRDVYTVIKARSLEEQLDKVEAIDQTPIFRAGVYRSQNIQTQKLLLSLARHLSKKDIAGKYNIDPSLFFKLSAAIINDQRDHSTRLHNLSGPKTSTVQEQYERLLIGYQYLRDNWNIPFSLQATAVVSMLSPYHFHRLFKNCFSVTPYQYHLRIKMEKALTILQKKDYAISEVSCHLGFKDTNTFRRAFKKFYGFTPSYARQNKHVLIQNNPQSLKVL